MFRASQLLESGRRPPAPEPTPEPDSAAAETGDQSAFANLEPPDPQGAEASGAEASGAEASTSAAPVAAPAAVQSGDAPVDAGPEGVRDRVRESYLGLVDAARQVVSAATAGTRPGTGILDACKAILACLQQGDGLLTEAVRQRNLTSTLEVQTANTTILSTRLGMESGYDERRCLALAMCGLMHDIGMLTIPKEVLEAPRLSEEQLRLLRNHPVESMRRVQRMGKDFSWIARVVVQVHERWNGSGYPNRLAQESIHEFARIIGLADSYEAMTHPRPDREAQITYRALTAIIDNRNRLFEPRLVRCLVHIVSIFPLGSLVRLNNGAIGRVVSVNRLYAARPVVDILVEPDGRRVDPPRQVALEGEPMLYIADPGVGSIEEELKKGGRRRFSRRSGS